MIRSCNFDPIFVKRITAKQYSSRIMNDIFPSDSNLEKFFDQQKIIEDTAAQLIKDFAEFSFEIKFTGKEKTAYEELFQQAEPVISHLLDKNNSLLFSVLYRIDVSENEIKKHTRKFPDQNMSYIITDLILRRELKKVLTRNYFRNK